MASAFVTLRALHILFAVLWAGAAFWKTAVVHNIARRGASGARFLSGYLSAGVGATFQTAAAAGTVVFGFLTQINGDYGPDALGSLPFLMFNLAMAAALAALLLALVWQLPAERRAQPLAQADLEDTLEDRRALDVLLQKVARLDSINAVLVTVALLGMVGFRLV